MPRSLPATATPCTPIAPKCRSATHPRGRGYRVPLAEAWLHGPDGGPVPGSHYCTPCAQGILAQYERAGLAGWTAQPLVFRCPHLKDPRLCDVCTPVVLHGCTLDFPGHTFDAIDNCCGVLGLSADDLADKPGDINCPDCLAAIAEALGTQSVLESMRYYLAMAARDEDRAATMMRLGLRLDIEHPESDRHLRAAMLYQRTAQALKLEVVMGKPHCCTCLKEAHPEAAPCAPVN